MLHAAAIRHFEYMHTLLSLTNLVTFTLLLKIKLCIIIGTTAC